MKIMTKRIAAIAIALILNSIVALASGVADMSGTTFTTQFHIQPSNGSLFPMFAVLLLGGIFGFSLRSKTGAGPADSSTNIDEN